MDNKLKLKLKLTSSHLSQVDAATKFKFPANLLP